jgi:hypothetical protein
MSLFIDQSQPLCCFDCFETFPSRQVKQTCRSHIALQYTAILACKGASAYRCNNPTLGDETCPTSACDPDRDSP